MARAAAAGSDAGGEPGAAYPRGVAARPLAERRKEARPTLGRESCRKVNRRPAPPSRWMRGGVVSSEDARIGPGRFAFRGPDVGAAPTKKLLVRRVLAPTN